MRNYTECIRNIGYDIESDTIQNAFEILLTLGWVQTAASMAQAHIGVYTKVNDKIAKVLGHSVSF